MPYVAFNFTVCPEEPEKMGGLTFWRRTTIPGSCGGDAEVGKFRGVLKAPRNDPKLRKGSAARVLQLQHDYLHYLSYHLSAVTADNGMIVDIFVIKYFIYHGKTGLY